MASLARRRGMADVAALATPAAPGKVGAPLLVSTPPIPPLTLGAGQGVKDSRPTGLCARRGFAGAPPLAIGSKQRQQEESLPLVSPPCVADLPPLALGAKQASGDAKPPSMGARRGMMDLGSLNINTQKGASKSALTLNSRLGRRPELPGLAITPPARLPRCDSAGELFSPVSSLTSTELPSEPPSPSASEVSIEDWGYDVGETLGAGSIGIVSSVRRRSDGSELACKHVRSNEQEQLDGLQHEYELLSSLSHGSIISPHAFYKCYGNAWMCVEWCRGGSVEACVRSRGAFAQDRGLALALRLLEGIDYLHCKRVVHRDVKPDNLLLQEDLSGLKLADFGSASRVGSAALGRVMLSARGTQLYNAPELRFGLQWNERVDIWAAGLCAFFLLRAELPFDAAARKATRRLQAGRLPEVAWGGLEGQAKDLLQQCLKVEMRDRPTAMELVKHPALEQLPTSLAAEALPPRAAARNPRDAALARLWASRRARAAGGRGAAHEAPL